MTHLADSGAIVPSLLPVARAGAGLGVVPVLLAVVVPAEELEVVEVGGAAAGPVRDVVGLAVVGGPVAAGGLAVPVAYDEGFPLRGARVAGGAADVEDARPTSRISDLPAVRTRVMSQSHKSI